MSAPFKMKGDPMKRNFGISPAKNRTRPKTEPVNPRDLPRDTNVTPRRERERQRRRNTADVERLSRLL